jgi:ABC-type lipoprotein release transport system permease subunit
VRAVDADLARLLAASLALALALVISLGPALSAAKLRPAETLHRE